MPTLPSILAEGDGIVKVVMGIVVLVIWGIGALANIAKKQNQQTKAEKTDLERALAEQMEVARRQQAQALGEASPPTRLSPPAALQPRPQQQQRRQTPPQRQPSHGPAVPPMRTLPQSQPMRGRPAQGPRVQQVPPVPPAVRRQPPAPARQQAGLQHQPAQRPAQQPPRRRSTAPAVPVPIPASAARSRVSGAPGVVESEIGRGASPARRAASMAADVMLSLTPDALRRQFILTEILQPPLALRDPAPLH